VTEEPVGVTTESGPWGMVPVWVLGLGLSGSELAVYVALRSYADRSRACFPLTAAIADRAHVSTRSVERALARFRDLEIVVTKRRYRDDGSIAGLVYRMLDVKPLHLLGDEVEPAPDATDATDAAETTTDDPWATDTTPDDGPADDATEPRSEAIRRDLDADRELFVRLVGVDRVTVADDRVFVRGEFAPDKVWVGLRQPWCRRRKIKPGAWLSKCHDIDQALSTLGIAR